MDSAASEPQVDLTVGADDVVDGPATSKGHRGLDDIWDHFKKIKLDSNAAKSLHRNYDATCKGCAERVVGKPEKMRRHLVNCSKAAPTSQLHALKQQAQRAGSHASQTCSQSNQGLKFLRSDSQTRALQELDHLHSQTAMRSSLLHCIRGQQIISSPSVFLMAGTWLASGHVHTSNGPPFSSCSSDSLDRMAVVK
ncbi:TPA: hypothetical protein ACH3X1_014801 [Trebouxia sp. C0004]